MRTERFAFFFTKYLNCAQILQKFIPEDIILSLAFEWIKVVKIFFIVSFKEIHFFAMNI